MTNLTPPLSVDKELPIVERIDAICSEVDAFNPDMRTAARSVFEAQEKIWKLVPQIRAALARAGQ